MRERNGVKSNAGTMRVNRAASNGKSMYNGSREEILLMGQ